MVQRSTYDAVVVGAGPNGLAAAVRLAQEGRQVLLVEAKPTVGGGTRTQELTLPGFKHDVCSAIHPLGVGSPFLKTLPLDQYGLEWVYPPANVAHPLDDGSAVVLEKSIAATASNLGEDGLAYAHLMRGLVKGWDKLAHDTLGPLRWPQSPFVLAGFGLNAVQPATLLAKTRFKHARARALFAGLASHAMISLDRPPSAAFGLVLGILGHSVGWPFPRGGASKITEAMAAYFEALGGEIVTNFEVKALEELPTARAYLLDVTPRQLIQIAGRHLPEGYKKRLARYRYGFGCFKVDYALDGPVPWQAEESKLAATVHVGGTLDEIAHGEKQVSQGQIPQKPFVLVTQPSLFDDTRAPQGQHTLWAYCHVPNGSTADMTEAITAQIERFAPGFRQRILAQNTMSPADMQAYSPNYIGGDINGGVQDLFQLFTRPVIRLNPYTTPAKNIFLCSSSTPPGGGVHGMSGFFAAEAALNWLS